MPSSTTGLWGLFEYKYSWHLTLKGLLLFFLIVSSVVAIIFLNIYPFLAISKPVEANVLIVEGWLDDAVLVEALQEFKRGKYIKLITTGTTFSKGSFLSSYKNHAELAAATLIKLGLTADKIMIIPTPEVQVNRTLASAKEVKKWLLDLPVDFIKGVNIYSYDVHTRRSWLVFKKALQPEILKVGSIASLAGSSDYSWYSSSEGIKSVITEAIAYVYSLFTGQF